jgi:hypothetical protein
VFATQDPELPNANKNIKHEKQTRTEMPGVKDLCWSKKPLSGQITSDRPGYAASWCSTNPYLLSFNHVMAAPIY